MAAAEHDDSTPALVLGPVLRHVGQTDATIWVHTDRACLVTVRAGEHTASAGTFRVAGHHYALVLLTGLPAGAALPYTVRLDDEQVWPQPAAGQPPSRIRLIDPERPVRLVFGSCRYATPATVGGDKTLDADALDSFAVRMAGQPEEQWPDALLLLGDQVYADETSPVTQDFIRRRRDISEPPGTEVADFEEYTRLYLESWGDPDVRWLLSTLPSSMIFDDHDVKDDWNTSHAWRVEMQQTSWWEERITGGLMSYWVYQHLGNLSPQALAEDQTWTEVQRLAAEGTDCEPYLRDFAQAADREADGAKGARWSYRRDLGRVRLLVVDSRCGRVLADERRSMLSEPEFAWVERQVEDGTYDHLLVGTSLPWLMPRALHDVESWDEALAAGSRGPWLADKAEAMRRAGDLEHWAAFRESFDRLAALLARVGRGEHGSAPATICVLSGDVHHAYVAEAHYPQPVQSRVYQLTCSPVHNEVQSYMHLGFRAGWSRVAEWLTTRASRLAKVPAVPLRWSRTAGPFFGNEIATLTLDGRAARLTLEKTGQPTDSGQGQANLLPVAGIALAATRDRR